MSDDPPIAPEGRNSWTELPALVLIALVLALLIKTFLAQAFYIPSASMENTLQGGNPTCDACGQATPGHPFDRILVNKLVYRFRSPRRGEVVVFKGPPGWPVEPAPIESTNSIVRALHKAASAVGLAPSKDSDFVKRVIGVAGDTVACRNDVLSVDGHVLDEPFLYPHSHPCSSDGFDGRTVHVPTGDIFVMGDHRDHSADSRVPGQGPVPVADVIGRASLVIWPSADWKTLPVPSTFAFGAAASRAGEVSLAALVLVGLVTVGWLTAVRRRRSTPRGPP